MARKKKRKFKWWVMPMLLLLLLSACLLVIYWWQVQQQNKARFTQYDGYNIPLPVGYPIHGIDVSYYQQYIYWPSVKQMKDEDISLAFVFIKATEGTSNTDKQFNRNWQQAKEQHITRGAYHFFIATKDGKQQAKQFIQHVKLSHGDLPPVIDVEQLYGVSASVMRQRLKACLAEVEKAYHVKPIIYSGADFYNNYLGNAFNQYPLWVAHYFEYNQPRVHRDWQFWQHSSNGKVSGIPAPVDFNVFNGDSTAFKKLLMP